MTEGRSDAKKPVSKHTRGAEETFPAVCGGWSAELFLISFPFQLSSSSAFLCSHTGKKKKRVGNFGPTRDAQLGVGHHPAAAGGGVVLLASNQPRRRHARSLARELLMILLLLGSSGNFERTNY